MKNKLIVVTILIINTYQYNYSGENKIPTTLESFCEISCIAGLFVVVVGGSVLSTFKIIDLNDHYLAPHSGLYIYSLEERLEEAIKDRDKKYKRSPTYQKKLEDKVTFYEQKIKEQNEKKEAQQKNKRELSEKVHPENKNSEGSFFFQTTINNRLIHHYWQLPHGQNYNGIAFPEIIQRHYTWKTNPLKQTAYVMLNYQKFYVNYIEQAKKYSELRTRENNTKRHDFQKNYGAEFTDTW
jgi:hypothetical protein